MLHYLTLIFCCQFVGEVIAGAVALAVPGPVIGMVILFLYLCVVRRVPENLGHVGSALQQHMSLLFVPAGTGVMLHFRLFGDNLLPIASAVIASTLLTIVLTGLVMQRLAKGNGDA